MSAESVREPLDPEIRFDTAADAPPAAPTCGRCSEPIATTYHEANGNIICPQCRAALEAEVAAGPSPGRFARATVYGIGGAAAGAGVYYAIVALTGYEIGLVAIAVGWLVGRAVQIGSRARGGWVYQGLAAVLTYLAIVSTYVPYILESFNETTPTAAVAAQPSGSPDAAAPGALEPVPAATDTSAAAASAAPELGSLLLGAGLLLLIAMAAPFLAGLENVLGILIIGFALFQAWKMNARALLVFTGPYALGTPRAPADA